jgi:tRNA A-37 threonylcarbamoyl transferase component Bud32
MGQDLKTVGAGRTAKIFRYGEKQVVKLFKETFPDKAIEEELAIGTTLNHVELDLPKTYERIDLNGRKGIILDYIEGKSMLQHLAIEPWMVLSYSKRMAWLHHRIHSATVPRSHLIPSLKNSLADKISRVPLLTLDERTAIGSYLSELQDGSAICHGDFHPDNIILTKNRLVTVDWITARIGDPTADVARTWLLLTMGTLPENKSAFEIYLARNLRDLFCRGYLREYKKLSDFSTDEFEAWKLPVAAARLIENVSDQENQNLLQFIRSRMAPTGNCH